MSMEIVLEKLATKLGRAEIQQVILETSLASANDQNASLQNDLDTRTQDLQDATAEVESLKEKLAEFLPPQTEDSPAKEEDPEGFPEESSEQV